MKRPAGLLLLLLVFGTAPRAGGSPTAEEFQVREVKGAELINPHTPVPAMTVPGKRVPSQVRKVIRRPIQHPFQAQPSRPGQTRTMRLRPKQQPSPLTRIIRGSASWYGPGFYGRQTASGERLRKGTFTAAHRTLPFGTKVRVTNLSNGRVVVVRINDRGPFKRHRVIDLAHGAASELRMMQAGEVPVRLEVLR